MAGMGSEDPFIELKESHRDYKVFDGHYERIGKVDELFVDEADHPVYLGVSTGGLLETGSVLIPMDLVRINDKRKVVEVAAPRERVEEAPSLGSGEEISPETEDRVRTYYGLEPLHSPGPQPGEADVRETEDRFAFDERVDLFPGEREAAQAPFEGAPPYRERGEQSRRDREAAGREDEDKSAGLREPAEERPEAPREEERVTGETGRPRVRRLAR